MADVSQLFRNGVDINMYKKLLSIVVILFFILPFFTLAQFGIKNDLVKISAESDSIEIEAGKIFEFEIEAVISKGWHINSNKPKEDFLIPTNLEIHNSKDFQIIEVHYPQSKDIQFSFSKNPISVFENNFLIKAKLKVSNQAVGNKELILRLNYQACNDASCMPPNVAQTIIFINVKNSNNNVSAQNNELSGTNVSQNSENSLANKIESSGIILSLLFVFLGGLALNLTPCVYPLIPITIGYFGGQSEGNTGRLFLLGVLYVLGMALTYSIIGVATAMSGAVLGTLLQNPVVIIIIALIFILLSLSMFGIYEFKLPDALVEKAGGAKAGAFGAFLMGLTMGIVAAPCIGPFVLGLLTYVAAKADILIGFLMFFFLALGLGTPYLILAVFSGKIKKLPRAGDWMDGVKHIFGFLLFGMAIYFVGPLLPKDINKYLIPIYLIFVGVYLIFFDNLANEVKFFRRFKIVLSLILIAVSVYLLIPTKTIASEWETYSDEKFESALHNEKIIIDFYADWCIPCKELDAITFSNPNVINTSKNFVKLKVDMTKTMSDETERIRKKFNILGMPTILIFDSNGNEVERITGFIDAEAFQKLLLNIN